MLNPNIHLREMAWPSERVTALPFKVVDMQWCCDGGLVTQPVDARTLQTVFPIFSDELPYAHPTHSLFLIHVSVGSLQYVLTPTRVRMREMYGKKVARKSGRCVKYACWSVCEAKACSQPLNWHRAVARFVGRPN